MKIDFTNIDKHIIPVSEFRLKWRFTEEQYDVLPNIHLDQLKPLDNQAALFLSTYILKVDLHAEVPFKKNFFRTVDNINLDECNNAEVKKWLYQRGLPFEKKVYLSWDNENAMIVPWKLLIKYFESFYYSGSDDLTVLDESLQWSLVFFHADTIYFGTNKDFVPSDSFENLENTV
jgi:hypothetical protein